MKKLMILAVVAITMVACETPITFNASLLSIFLLFAFVQYLHQFVGQQLHVAVRGETDGPA